MSVSKRFETVRPVFSNPYRQPSQLSFEARIKFVAGPTWLIEVSNLQHCVSTMPYGLTTVEQRDDVLELVKFLAERASRQRTPYRYRRDKPSWILENTGDRMAEKFVYSFPSTARAKFDLHYLLWKDTRPRTAATALELGLPSLESSSGSLRPTLDQGETA